MPSTDARPIPIKNMAYRISFPIFDADGDLVTGATGLDSEISKDSGTFADCTNEATEIAPSSGMYYLDLTATEMNADTVAIVVKTSTSGAKTTPIVLYPQESGDIKVDLQSISGSIVSTSSAQLGVNVVNAGGTSWGSGAITAGSIASNAITAAKIAADAIGAPQIAADAIGSSELAEAAIAEIAAAVWAETVRTLTSGANISLAKGTGITGFNDPTAATIADAVWEEANGDHTASGTFGLKINDVWGYGFATGGILSSLTQPAENPAYVEFSPNAFLNANLLRATSYVEPDNEGIAAIKVKTDNLPIDPASQSAVETALDGIESGGGATPEAIWAYSARSLTDKSDFNLVVPPATTAEIVAAIDAGSTQLAALQVNTGTDIPALIAALNDLDAAAVQAAAEAALAAHDVPTNTELMARTLPTSDYATAADLATVDTVVDAIKAKTDSLAFDSLAVAYQADITLADDDAGHYDRYVVCWFMNGEPIDPMDISAPTLQVVRASDGTNLIAATSMTQIGALPAYKHDEANARIVNGATYIAKAIATIDGVVHEWVKPFSRDSWSLP